MPIYDEAEQDYRFVLGIGQWDEKARKAREKKGRPCLTLNQMTPYVNQVVNDVRQANLAIRVSPSDDEADIETAEVLQGVIRNIEKISNADIAYITGVMNATAGGIGWLKIRVDWADEISFDREAYIERVLDFRKVYFDPHSMEFDGSDAEYAYVLHDYSKDEFEEKYPDAECVSFDEDSNEDTITVAEYYKKYYEEGKLYRIQLVDGSVQIINDNQKDALDEDGTVQYALIDERRVRVPYIKQYILCGQEEPLEETDFPGEYIPIVPVIGNEVYLDGKRQFQSLIKHGKDGQKLYNYWKTYSAEMVALQPKAPYVGAKGSFASYSEEWASANTEMYSTLEYDVTYDKNGQRVEPPRREQPAQIAPSIMQEANTAREDIMFALGMPRANMGQQGNEVSGVALKARTLEGDNATFHIVDNLAYAISQVGRILVGIIPTLYNQRKIARILGEDGTETIVPINQPYVQEDGGVRPARKDDVRVDGVYDFNVGKYDVVCDVGASYTSKRQEMADKLVELMSVRPELMDVTGDILFKALDLPMGQEISDRIKAVMDPAVLGDDPMAGKLQEAAQMVAGLQDQIKNYEVALKDKSKNQEFEQMVERAKLQLQGEELRLKAQETMANIEKMRSETMENKAQANEANAQAFTVLGEAMQGITARVDDITEALEIMFEAKQAEGVKEATSEPESVAESEEEEDEND